MKNDEIFSEYKRLDESEKMKLFTCLITKEAIFPGQNSKNNSNKLEKIKGISAKFLDFLKDILSEDYREKMNSLFEIIYASEGNDNFVALLLNSFQSIPEKVLSIKDKVLIAGVIGKKCGDQLSDLAYDDPMPSFSPAQYLPVSISKKEYKNAVSSGVDLSEYIILTLGIMKFLKVDSDDIENISRDFLCLKYEDCIQKINKKATVRSFIKEIDLEIKEVKFENNNPRRFFETRLSQYIVGSLQEQKNTSVLESVNKVFTFFIKKTSHQDLSVENIDQAISIIAEIGKDTARFPDAEKYKKRSYLYKTKDRLFQKGVERREQESKGKIGTVSILSRNGGALLSSSPNFTDSLLGEMRNRVSDSALRGPKLIVAKGKFFPAYSWNNMRHRSPYVGSLSGHTFRMVGVLEKYLKEHKGSSTLNQEINDFFMQFIAVYVKRGFHSIHEILDALMEVEDVFQNYGVTLDYGKLFPANHVAMALTDALAYTRRLCLQRGMHKQLLKPGLLVVPSPAAIPATESAQESKVCYNPASLMTTLSIMSSKTSSRASETPGPAQAAMSSESSKVSLVP